MADTASEPRLHEFDLQLVYDPAEPEARRWCGQLAYRIALAQPLGRRLYRAYAATAQAAAIAAFESMLKATPL